MQAPRGRGDIAPTHFRPGHWMGVSGRRDAPAAICPRGRETGWASSGLDTQA
jgi:hypothetical protein